MHILSKNNKEIFLRKLTINDLDKLEIYLQHLSDETKSRFGPHGYDKASLIEIYKYPERYIGYIAEDIATKNIVGYAVVKIGFLEHDLLRLQSQGIQPETHTDSTFAPSVADAWQSDGIGNSLFHFIINDFKNCGIKRIILWGGVKADNSKAINFYQKNGFKITGQFYYHGENFDMIRDV